MPFVDDSLEIVLSHSAHSGLGLLLRGVGAGVEALSNVSDYRTLIHMLFELNEFAFSQVSRARSLSTQPVSLHDGIHHAERCVKLGYMSSMLTCL
jgi:hypothetical protein